MMETTAEILKTVEKLQEWIDGVAGIQNSQLVSCSISDVTSSIHISQFCVFDSEDLGPEDDTDLFEFCKQTYLKQVKVWVNDFTLILNAKKE